MRLGFMCSGNGTNFENIVTNPLCNTNEVVLMIHNTKKCGAVERAAKFGIPHVRVPHKEEDKINVKFGKNHIVYDTSQKTLETKLNWLVIDNEAG